VDIFKIETNCSARRIVWYIDWRDSQKDCCGTVVVRATQDKFEVVLKIRKCVLEFAAEPPTRLTIASIRDKFWGLWYSACAEAKIFLCSFFLKERILALCTSTYFGYLFYLSFMSSSGMIYFTFNKMARHCAATRTSSYRDETLPGQRIGWEGSVEYHQRSPN
jgi:hypothetical protein